MKGILQLKYIVVVTLAFAAAMQAVSGNNDVLAAGSLQKHSLPNAKQVEIGDGGLSTVLVYNEEGLYEKTFKIDGGQVIDSLGVPWAVCLDNDIAVEPAGSKIKLAAESENNVRFTGENEYFFWTLSYQVTGKGRITKALTLDAKKDVLLKQVSLWNMASLETPYVASTKLVDIAAFYRLKECGMFASLDFPYSAIKTDNGVTKISYPPYKKLKVGEKYNCHTLTYAATALEGRMRYGHDIGEAAAMDSYIQERFPIRFNRPMFVTSSINNRYCMPQGDMIWYSMKDHPTLSFDLDLMRREIDMVSKLGIEYYQTWPGPFDAVPNDPDPKAVDDIVNYAHSKGVRVGDYSACQLLFCPHYNEYRNSLANHPQWDIMPEDVCFGNPEFVKFYIEQVTQNCSRYGFEIHCLDFLSMAPCNSKEHGHPIGQESLYAQILGLTNLLTAINSTSEEMMSWSNSGIWAELLPKIAWSNHNLYLTDPLINTPWQGLNMTRLLDDSRREQMVSLHNSYFIPYRFLTNLQYFFSQNSIVPDIRNYQYGALSTLAVTPNLGVGEIRPWIDRLPANKQQEVFDFYKKWTSFVTDNYEIWKTTYQLGDNPGTGSVEIYSHAKGDHGYVFIVNPNYWGKTVEVPLDKRLGFNSDVEAYEIAELYPEEQLRLTENGPFLPGGSVVPIYAAPQQVLVFEVRPAPKTIAKPRLYGLPGTVEKTNEGYLVKTTGPQGQTRRCAVLLPEGSYGEMSANVRADVPNIAKRLWSPTPVKILGGNHQGILMEVTFRNKAVPDELRDWTVKSNSLSEGIAGQMYTGFSDGQPLRFPLFVDVTDDVPLPLWDQTAQAFGMGALGSFCGAYIENAFGEEQQTWIDIISNDASSSPKIDTLAENGYKPAAAPISVYAKDKRNAWWAATEFYLPFMYTYGSEPFFDEHSFLVIPFIRQSGVQNIQAWINGKPLTVQAYNYPRNRSLGCYYADLVGSGAVGGGKNVLVIYFEMGNP